jgi:acyl carrier protein
MVIRMAIDEKALLDGFRLCLEETLGGPVPDLAPGQRLIGDLGLDSLDLLDLIFRLERRFKAKLNPKEFERRVKARLGDSPMVENGQYTAAAISEFRQAMPCVPGEELQAGLPVSGLFEVFRVQTFMNMVAEALARSGEVD